MLHLASVRIFSKAVVTLVPDIVRIGSAHARLLKTSIQVGKYLIPSLNGDRLEISTRSGTDLQYLSSTSCDEENEFSWVCVEYMHLAFGLVGVTSQDVNATETTWQTQNGPRHPVKSTRLC